MLMVLPADITFGCFLTHNQPMWEKKNPLWKTISWIFVLICRFTFALWGSASVSENLWWVLWSLLQMKIEFSPAMLLATTRNTRRGNLALKVLWDHNLWAPAVIPRPRNILKKLWNLKANTWDQVCDQEPGPWLPAERWKQCERQQSQTMKNNELENVFPNYFLMNRFSDIFSDNFNFITIRLRDMSTVIFRFSYFWDVFQIHYVCNNVQHQIMSILLFINPLFICMQQTMFSTFS